MLRLFDESSVRYIHDLDGSWRFLTDPAGTGEQKQYPRALPREAKRTIVPSCWQNDPALIRYEGAVWYQREFETRLPNVRLVFGAVNSFCDVYVDGNKLGSHEGGFTEFSFLLTDLKPGTHQLTLRVTNFHDEESTLPLTDVDWFHYGGIIRSIEVHEFENVLIERMRVDYELVSAMKAARVDVTAQVFAAREYTGDAVLLVDGEPVSTVRASVSGEGTLNFSFVLSDLRLWSPENPALYRFTLRFGGDELIDRTGFRKIEIRGHEFYLNGQKLWMKGINHHEEHPDWGFAVPAALMVKDINLIRQMGCNIMRGSHYPNAKAALDYMDETGMLFWEEIPMWRFPENALANPVSRARGQAMLREMVQRDFNHPAIIIWGMNNEVDNTCQAAWEVQRLFRQTLREMDETRLITYASDVPLQDICQEFADFISVNQYVGWYGPTLEHWPEFLDQLEDYLQKTGNADKPVVISEFGAGGIYGERALEDVFWTENYQQEYLDYTLGLFRAHPRINGTFIWQYADLRSCLARDRTLARPRSFNNKGVFNEYRHPKLAYETVKKHYLDT